MGRLRPPEYVAAAVNACLLARAGEPYDTRLLQDVFSRSGFTDSYLTGARNGSMFGTRTEGDAAAAKAGGTAPAGAVPPRTPPRGRGAGADFGRGRREAGRPGRRRQPCGGVRGAAAPARAEAAGGGAGGLTRPLAGKKWAGPRFSAGGRGAGRTVVPAGQRGERAAPSGAGVPAGKAGAATPHPVRKSAAALLEAPARAAKQEGYAVRLAHAAQLPRETPQDAAWFIMPLASAGTCRRS